ncbi:MAG: alpha-amylase [Treponemataceae bacterium]|nr:alpha-amylase [Treponemataceae bacterium]
MEFHVSKKMRDICKFDGKLFSFSGNVIFSDFANVRKFAHAINSTLDPVLEANKMIKAGQLNAMGLIDEILHLVCSEFRKQENPKAFEQLEEYLDRQFGKKVLDDMLLQFTEEFPPLAVYQGKIDAVKYLEGKTEGVSNRITTIEELMLLHLANENPAFGPFLMLFSDAELAKNKNYHKAWFLIQSFFKSQPLFGPFKNDLITMMREPAVFSPLSLKGQLDYIRQNWTSLLDSWVLKLLSGIDMINEEEKPGWNGNFSGLPPMESYNYDSLMNEYERFSPDQDWMPKVVLLAKTVLVWLDQLSKKYKRRITQLDQIPDEELDQISQAGFTGLWLIGLWERSWGSKRIKQKCGNPEAAASAYSLHDYDIAQELGGWSALDNLRRRCWYRGIRLASDMVPNHTGLDSKWVAERPDLFMQTRECPFPGYTFNNENLSIDPRIQVYIEDHYYSKSDCAVVYKRVDSYTGDTRYIYHGNDGTGLPWNDTAQIDFLNPEAREEVIQKILHVARNFPIIRFDAAMVLAKKSIKRLWYPEPGHGGDIASRAEHALSNSEFEKRIPEEFWREVVDRCAREVPDTLLLAEAFWMMEGYFVRTLGMHRVYNSAFMNMLKKEENQKYRDTVKNTLEFDPQVLKRFVNFMNNPDEETAVAQFGKGDKYFGVCTLMVTMPGLPMFGHGQIEGFEEKYGMEYTKAYRDEVPDYDLVDRHKHDIFPLMKKRYLFSGIENFFFYDVWNNGTVNENVFAYTNMAGSERAIVFYNNAYQCESGWIKTSCRYAVKDGDSTHFETKDLADALQLPFTQDTYLIFREQHSEKWFIRSIPEIRKNGLFMSLQGFEYQVLLDITVVADDDTGKYKLLHDTLNGKGTDDIDTAIREIFLKDLYKSLKLFATPEFFKGIDAVCKGTAPQSRLTKVLSAVKPMALDYFKTLTAFLDGNYGSKDVLNKSISYQRLPPESAWKKFMARTKRIVELCTGTAPISNSLSEYGKQGIQQAPYNIMALAAYSIAWTVQDVLGSKATATDTRNVITLWGIDRKLRDILCDYGLPSKDLYTFFWALLETAPFCDTQISELSWQTAAYRAASSLINNRHAGSILGINQYNNILWINKEKAEWAVWTAVLQYMLFAADKSNVHLLERIRDTLLSALASSGYKTEDLLKLLKPAVEYDEPTRKRATRTARKPVTGAASKKNSADAEKSAKGAKKAVKSSGEGKATEAKKSGATTATKAKKPAKKSD